MDDYVSDALAQNFICPSSAAYSFFFVGEKYGGLRLCTDYRMLNSHTRKFSFPLPLIPAALEQLRNATTSPSLICEASTTSSVSSPVTSGKLLS
ncbi:MAG: hypothetical protein ACRC9V_12900 [Aeromonas sp.]